MKIRIGMMTGKIETLFTRKDRIMHSFLIRKWLGAYGGAKKGFY